MTAETKVNICTLLTCSRCRKGADLLFDSLCVDCYVEEALLNMTFVESAPNGEDDFDNKFFKGD